MDEIDINDIYLKMPLGDIPWNQETPPPLLVSMVESGTVSPCRAVDLGCGAGNYSRYLASKGFDVTGIDISPEAIRIASKMAEEKGLDCRFLCADIAAGLPPSLQEQFDFALEWEVLHHIYPGQRDAWAGNVHKLLAPGGRYFAVCFHEKDRTFEGSGKYRTTRIGTRLYFSGENELHRLYAPLFNILELKMIRITGRHGDHFVNYAFLQKPLQDAPAQRSFQPGLP